MKRNLFAICLLLVILVANNVFGQKNIQFSHYMFSPLQFNPAYAGTKDAISGSLLYNAQWIGFEGAPRVQSINIHAPVGFSNAGIGLSVVNESVAVINNTDIMVCYAFRIPTKNGTISLGLQGGVLLRNENFSELTTIEAGDNQYTEDINKILFNAGLGLFYYSDNFYMGVSIPKLLDNNIDYLNDQPENTFDPLANPYYIASGYVANVGEQLKLKPSILFKHLIGNPFTIDLNLNALYKETFGIGASYRYNSSIGIMAEFFFMKYFMLGYAYNISTNKLASYNTGTHEIMLAFDIYRKSVTYRSPRYF